MTTIYENPSMSNCDRKQYNTC